jgi:hypothetical protein
LHSLLILMVRLTEFEQLTGSMIIREEPELP